MFMCVIVCSRLLPMLRSMRIPEIIPQLNYHKHRPDCLTAESTRVKRNLGRKEEVQIFLFLPWSLPELLSSPLAARPALLHFAPSKGSATLASPLAQPMRPLLGISKKVSSLRLFSASSPTLREHYPNFDNFPRRTRTMASKRP